MRFYVFAVAIALAVVIQYIDCASYYRYSLTELKTASMNICCPYAKRDKTDDDDSDKQQNAPAISSRKVDDDDVKHQNVPTISKRNANSFISDGDNPLLARKRRNGIIEECCREGCNHEEVREGSGRWFYDLGEECIHEGCTVEEIREHCY